MLLWAGQAVSAVGTRISQLAFPLLVLALTRSPAQAGLVGALAALPYVIFGLVAGAAADRWDRKRVMILCDLGRVATLGSIPVALALGHLTLTQLYLVALLAGTLDVFFDLAETAALPRVVPVEQLPSAMGQNSATFSAASLIGQSLGGVLFQLGRAIPFLADAVSYGASVGSLLFIRARFQRERTTATGTLVMEIKEGLAWLWGHPLIRFMGFLNAGAWIVFSSNYLVVIVLAREHGARPAEIGFLLAMVGIGGIAGGSLAGWVQRRLTFAQVVVGGVWLWAVIWPLYALAPSLLSIGAVSALLFLVFPIYSIVQMSYRLALIPDELQGRVNSAFRIIAFSGQPVGYALAGVLLQSLGSRSTVLILWGWLLVLAAAAAVSKPVRHAVPLTALRSTFAPAEGDPMDRAANEA